MSLPVFYLPDYDTSLQRITLDEDTSKHVIQVLRMKIGDQLQLTDGKGTILMTEITDDNKKKCVVRVIKASHEQQSARKVTIAISLIKNPGRFEWFLEKATEIGVTQIIPMLCSRTEKQKIRMDRMHNIIVSAMLQSQQCWLPQLKETKTFEKIIENEHHQKKFIAHCLNDERSRLPDTINEFSDSQIILIGPEGDFTPSEIEKALQFHFTPVTLGSTRLRSETAGIVAAVLLKNY